MGAVGVFTRFQCILVVFSGHGLRRIEINGRITKFNLKISIITLVTTVWGIYLRACPVKRRFQRPPKNQRRAPYDHNSHPQPKDLSREVFYRSSTVGYWESTYEESNNGMHNETE